MEKIIFEGKERYLLNKFPINKPEYIVTIFIDENNNPIQEILEFQKDGTLKRSKLKEINELSNELNTEISELKKEFLYERD